MRFGVRLGLWWLALVVAVQGGCATVPACPAKGGPAWRELTSDHFVLRTDLDDDDALQVLRRLEDTRAAMLAVFWPRAPELGGRIDAYALASRGEVEAYLGPHFAAIHLRAPPFPPTLLIPGLGRDNQLHANHEIAHALSLQLEPVQPLWFAEGLADYLSTVHRDAGDESRIVAGDLLMQEYAVVQRYGVAPIETVLGSMPEDSFERHRFYATSWLLFHYLFNVRPAELDGFQRRLGRLEPGPEAFRAEFPDLAAGKLEAVLKQYAFAGRYTTTTRSLPPWNGQHQTRLLSDAEVHASRALVAVMAGPAAGRGEEAVATARPDVTEALQDPRPPIEALVLAFYEQRLVPSLSKEDIAKRAVKTHPENWMSWLMASLMVPPGSPARREALRRALAADPEAVEALSEEALELGMIGRWSEMLRITNQILGAGAVRHEVWMLHLSALIHTGHCHEAELWGTALQGFLNAKEAGEIGRMRARLICAPPVSSAPAGSLGARAYAGKGR